ncbi:hypothetical protein AB0I81_56625 [Nonomuraea sp. NPDC050404]
MAGLTAWLDRPHGWIDHMAELAARLNWPLGWTGDAEIVTRVED